MQLLLSDSTLFGVFSVAVKAVAIRIYIGCGGEGDESVPADKG